MPTKVASWYMLVRTGVFSEYSKQNGNVTTKEAYEWYHSPHYQLFFASLNIFLSY